MKTKSTTTKPTIDLLLAHAFGIGLVLIVLREFLQFSNIAGSLAFYGTFHRDPINQIIHFFGVPCIIWSAILFFAHLPLPFVEIYISLPGIPHHRVTYSTILFVGYTISYVVIDKIGGLCYAPVMYLKYLTSVRMVLKDQELTKKKEDGQGVRWYGTGYNLKVAAWAQIISWYLQIHPGHAIFEGAKPAILTAIGPTLSIAPLFAFYEGLWFLGINKQLQEQTVQIVAENTAKLCAAGSTMRACAGL